MGREVAGGVDRGWDGGKEVTVQVAEGKNKVDNEGEAEAVGRVRFIGAG